MQQAIPYKSWPPLHAAPPPARLGGRISSPQDHQEGASVLVGSSAAAAAAVAENAVMVFSRRGCCMGQVARHLLLCHGVNPGVYELEDDSHQARVAGELELIVGGGRKASPMQFPAVFIGGKLLGGLDRVMAAHISGDLVPLLKQAGALWL